MTEEKIIHQGSGTIPALADEELIGEDDDYDDLYSDVNVGESFFQAHHQPPPQPPQQPQVAAAPTVNVSEQRMPIVQQQTRPDAYPQQQQQQQTKPHIVLNNNTVHVPEQPPQVHNPYVAPPQPPQMNKPPPPVQLQPQPFVVDNGNTMLFVGELHWWTTDAEIESVLSQYGRVKEIKFFDERVSGKSKGYCQVEFYDSASAAACQGGMNGYVFNGKACVVAFASPETLKQMGANFTGRNQTQNQIQNRRPLNEGTGRGMNNNNNNMNNQNGDGGRNYGRGGFARGQGVNNRPWGGNRPRGMNNAASGVGPYGPNPTFGSMMHPQGMMTPGGFDPTFGRGAGGYGTFPGMAYPGMTPYQGVNTMGMVGIAPHVNPAFFGSGMGTMSGASMNGVMWNEAGNGGGEENGSEYGGYEDETQEKEDIKQPPPRAITERSENSGGERRHKSSSSYREERDSSHHQREYKRDRDYDEYDRGGGQSSSMKSRSRSRMSEDDHHRSRSRESDYGKRSRRD